MHILGTLNLIPVIVLYMIECEERITKKPLRAKKPLEKVKD